MLAYFVQSLVEGTVKLSYKIVLLSRPTFANCSYLLSLTLSDDRNSRVGQKNTVFSNKEKMFKFSGTAGVCHKNCNKKFVHIYVFIYIYNVMNVHFFLCSVMCIYRH